MTKTRAKAEWEEKLKQRMIGKKVQPLGAKVVRESWTQLVGQRVQGCMTRHDHLRTGHRPCSDEHRSQAQPFCEFDWNAKGSACQRRETDS